MPGLGTCLRETKDKQTAGDDFPPKSSTLLKSENKSFTRERRKPTSHHIRPDTSPIHLLLLGFAFDYSLCL